MEALFNHEGITHTSAPSTAYRQPNRLNRRYLVPEDNYHSPITRTIGVQRTSCVRAGGYQNALEV